jgi:uncharacterized protein
MAQRYRAFQFLHPDLDASDMEAGLRIAPTGGIAMVDEHASVRQAVLLLLSTIPGERVMRPDYGCDLYRVNYSPNDDTTAGLAIHYVRRALERWEPRIEVVRIDSTRSDSEPGSLILHLEYKVRLTHQTEYFRLPVSLTGEPS